MKKISLAISFSLIVLIQISIFNSLNFENKSIINNSYNLSRNINLTNEQLSNDLYSDYYNNNFDVTFSSTHISPINYKFISNKLSITDDYNQSNKILIDDATSNLDDQTKYYKTPYIDIWNAQINNNQIIIPDNYLPYKEKKRCGKKHSKMVFKCTNPGHKIGVHNRGCYKSVLYDCTGCLRTINNYSFKKQIKINDYKIFLNIGTISSKYFDFGNLIELDSKNSFKSFNKNVISFKFNYDYLKSMILKSFNKWISTQFDKYNWMFSEYQNTVILNAIKQNKIIIFDNKIFSDFGYNNTNYNEKHNLRFWQNNIDNFNDLQLEKEINELPILDFEKYAIENNIDPDIYMGKKLLKIFYDDNFMKNIYFKIRYDFSDRQIKEHIISLHELYNGINNKIIYFFKDNYQSIYLDKQSININSISLCSKDNNLIFVNEYPTGMIFDNKLLKPNESIDNPFIKFNPLTNYASHFNKIEMNENISRKILLANNINGFASDNLDLQTLKVAMLFNNYIKYNDENYEKDSLLSFQNYISDIKMVHYDLEGKINIIIKFNDDSILEFPVLGFDKQLDDFITYTNDKFECNDISNINLDKKYILDNFISYKGNEKNKYLLKVDLTKDDFENNVLKDIEINYDEKEILIHFYLYDQFNKDILFTISKTQSINNESNLDDKQNLDNNLQNNAISSKKLYMIIGVVTSISIILVSIILIFVFLKNKNKRKK